MNLVPFFRAAVAAPALAVGLLATSAAPALAGPWTSPASACVPDEDSVATAVMTGPAVGVSSATYPRTVRLRCNVTDVFARQGFASPVKLAARFIDDGTDATVLVQLFEHDFTTGAVRLLLTLNSDSVAPAAAPQNHAVSAGCAFSLNFSRSAYWVEAQVIRRSAASVPALHQVRLIDEVLC